MLGTSNEYKTYKYCTIILKHIYFNIKIIDYNRVYMSSLITLMYVSCFNYKNLWSPFFKLKEKYLGDKIKTYLCIDELKNHKINFSNTEIINFNQKSIYNLNGNLYDRYLYYLNNIDSKYVIYFIDDMFILENVNLDKVNEFIQIMEQNDYIKIIKLSLMSWPFDNGTMVNYNDNKFIQADNNKDEYIMNLQPILINKKFFINIVEYCKHQDQNRLHCYGQNSGLESFGTEYFKNKNYKCLRVMDDIIKVIHPGGFVRSGVLSEEFKNYLKEKENIDIKTFKYNLIYDINDDEYNNLPQNAKDYINE